MTRLVVPPPKAGEGREAARVEGEQRPDGYLDRVIKYVPAETIAFFTAVDRTLIGKYDIQPDGSIGSTATGAPVATLSILLLLLCIVVTPFYLRQRRTSPRERWGVHAVVATVAFVAWSYTIGGSFFLLNRWYDPFGAALIAPFFTFIAGAIVPRAPEG